MYLLSLRGAYSVHLRVSRQLRYFDGRQNSWQYRRLRRGSAVPL